MILFRIFTVYVRPVLEYASVLWNPSKKVYIRKLENVQKYFLKRIYGLDNSYNYMALLRENDIPTLQERRVYFDLLYAYKIIHGLLADGGENYSLGVLPVGHL